VADCGADLALQLVEKARKKRRNPAFGLRDAMLDMFPEPGPVQWPEQGPMVLLVVGVNGTGKTTTIGKLAAKFRQEGRKVLIAAADTFRAAAVDQLEVWVQRAGADMIRQGRGSRSGSCGF